MNHAFKMALAWAAPFTLFALGACSEVNDDSSGLIPQSAESSVLVRIPQFNVETIANVDAIELFQYADGVFVKKMTVDPSKENTVEFPRLSRTRIFAIAAHSLDGKEHQAESDFSSMTILMPEESHSAPVFFSSVTEIHEGSNRVDIELRRAVSRLDIANNDPELNIERVSISGACSSTLIFPMDGRTCKHADACYSRDYESGIEGVAERAFVLFETSTPVAVTISGKRCGKSVEITAETPAIVRNTLYTVTIEKDHKASNQQRDLSDTTENPGEDDEYTTTIKVSDWQDGDVKKATMDLGETAIDLGRSYIPSGVRVEPSDNSISVPAEGVSGMRLAFHTAAPLSLGSVISDTDGVSITPAQPLATAEGYVSVFIVDVAGQPKCGAKYQATVFFHGSSDFFINIEVAPSPYQIPTVRIGGHDWMCFNAVSQDPEQQIFLPQGMTVEKMYTDRFVECIGNMFQQGRPDPFSPWIGYDPNQNAALERDNPWTRASMMPMPKGYHVATQKEWEDLIPSGTVIPSTYTTPYGETIKASLYTFPGILDDTPSASTNAMKYLKRCVILESLTTGTKLCLPMGGIKTNTDTEIPTQNDFRFDTRSGYWMAEHEKVMLLDHCTRCDGSEGIRMERKFWHEDGFVMVRGVKD